MTEKEVGKLIAQVWEDPQLKARLVRDPQAVLAEYGVELPAGLDIQVLECTDKITYIVLPPAGEESNVPQMDKLPESYDLGAVYQVVITKAGKDPAFRQLALSDPMAALRQIGVSIPEGHEVKVVEATAAKTYLIIPPAPPAELSLEEMDMVAGGKLFAVHKHVVAFANTNIFANAEVALSVAAAAQAAVAVRAGAAMVVVAVVT